MVLDLKTAHMCYAGVTIIAKSLSGLHAIVLVWWQCLIGVFFLIWTPFVYGLPENTSSWFWLMGLGGFHTGLAYILLYSGVAKLNLNQTVILQFVYPLVAVIVDALVYQRVLESWQLLGVALMAFSIWSIRQFRMIDKDSLR